MNIYDDAARTSVVGRPAWGSQPVVHWLRQLLVGILVVLAAVVGFAGFVVVSAAHASAPTHVNQTLSPLPSLR